MQTTPLKALLIAAAMIVSAPASFADDAATAAANAEVKKVVEHHIDALNNGDVAAKMSDWEESGTLVDAFPPFEWKGREPIKQWWTSLEALLKVVGFNSAILEVRNWQRLQVVGDHAMVVAETTVTMSGPSKSLKANGNWTIILNRTSGAWRISSWTMSGPPAGPAISP